jgi:thiamine monophosphate synthase
MSPAVTLPPLNAILDHEVARRGGWTLEELAKACLAGGARFLQIRVKHLAGGPFLGLCDQIVRVAEPHNAIVIVNDRADLAAYVALRACISGRRICLQVTRGSRLATEP